MNQNKLKHQELHRDFLLSFFSSKPKYEMQEINGFILTKSINGATEEPYVQIYTKESYEKRQAFLRDKKAQNEGQAVTQLNIT